MYVVINDVLPRLKDSNQSKSVDHFLLLFIIIYSFVVCMHVKTIVAKKFEFCAIFLLKIPHEHVLTKSTRA